MSPLLTCQCSLSKTTNFFHSDLAQLQLTYTKLRFFFLLWIIPTHAIWSAIVMYIKLELVLMQWDKSVYVKQDYTVQAKKKLLFSLSSLFFYEFVGWIDQLELIITSQPGDFVVDSYRLNKGENFANMSHSPWKNFWRLKKYLKSTWNFF